MRADPVTSPTAGLRGSRGVGREFGGVARVHSGPKLGTTVGEFELAGEDIDPVGRGVALVGPRRRVPDSPSTKRLCAVHEDFDWLNDDDRLGSAQLIIEGAEQRWVDRHVGRTVHTKRFVATGNHEQATGLTGFDNVAERVNQVVAVEVGDSDRPRLEDTDETRRAATRRHIESAAAVRRGDHQKRAPANEPDAHRVERRFDFVLHQLDRLSVELTQLFERRQHMWRLGVAVRVAISSELMRRHWLGHEGNRTGWGVANEGDDWSQRRFTEIQVRSWGGAVAAFLCSDHARSITRRANALDGGGYPGLC